MPNLAQEVNEHKAGYYSNWLFGGEFIGSELGDFRLWARSIIWVDLDTNNYPYIDINPIPNPYTHAFLLLGFRKRRHGAGIRAVGGILDGIGRG